MKWQSNYSCTIKRLIDKYVFIQIQQMQRLNIIFFKFLYRIVLVKKIIT